MSRSRCRNDRALTPRLIWTRLLSLHFGATVYTFALIPQCSSSPGHRQRDRRDAVPQPAGAAAHARLVQLLLCGAIRGRRTSSPNPLPYGRSTRRLPPRRGSRCSSILVRCLWVVLPGRSCGARAFAGAGGRRVWERVPRKTKHAPSRPAPPAKTAGIAIRSGRSAACQRNPDILRRAPGEQDAARLAGGVYAANTVGASSARWRRLRADSVDRQLAFRAVIIIASALSAC